MFLLVAGCGKSSLVTAPDTPAQLRIDMVLAKHAVLKLSDLPAGYESTRNDRSPAPKPVVRRFAKCAKLPESKVAAFINQDDPSEPSVDSADFDRDDNGPSLGFQNRVAIGRSSRDRSENLRLLTARSALKCWANFFRAGFKGSSRAVTSARGLSVVSIPNCGCRRRGRRIRSPGHDCRADERGDGLLRLLSRAQGTGRDNDARVGNR